MKYQSRKTKLVIAMISISLTGLMAVQLLLLSIAWELKDQAFGRNVITALTICAQNMEIGGITDEAIKIIYQFELADSLHQQVGQFEFHSTDLQQLSHDISIVPHDTVSVSRKLTVFMGEDRSQLIQQIVDDLVIQTPRPIEERLNRAKIDSLLRLNLESLGISLPPEFYVIAADGDSVILAGAKSKPQVDVTKLRKSPFQVRLFPLDSTSPAYELVLLFPGQRSFLLKQIWPLLAASIVFIAVIITAFLMMISAGNQQRRFARDIVDFINNMTHEFKTPISTVALASEAIARKDILDHPEALQRYNRMIGDENHRMGQQVERILQIAQLETGDFQLNRTSVDIHHLIISAADNFALQIEKRSGSLDLFLAANKSVVHGDAVHLSNVLSNLLDNAIKYSPETPVISLSTRNNNENLIIEVRDQGIGIQNTDQDRVFEKYYRCPTGDRHDVKGFGLGLAYVRLLVEAHGGEIELSSSQGLGTCVVLTLPLGWDTHQSGGTK